MVRIVKENAWYGECLPDHTYAYLSQGKVITHFGSVDCSEDGNILFLRCFSKIHPDGNNIFKMAGQSHNGRGNVEWTSETKKWNIVGEGYGVNTVLYDDNGNLIQGDVKFGSQGLRFFDKRIFTGDETYFNEGYDLSQWSYIEDVLIGQNHSGPGAISVVNGKKRFLEDGNVEFIRFTYANGIYAISIVKPIENRIVFFWASYTDLLNLPLFVGSVEEDKPTIPPPIDVPPIEPPKEFPKMKLPLSIQNTVRTFYNNHSELSKGSDDQRRELMKLIIEQIVFDNPAKGYGWKSADRNRPPSKDALAKKEGDNLIGWDLFNGSTREPVIDPDSMDLTGQFFIDITGVNHLKSDSGSTPNNPVPNPNNPPSPNSGSASEELQKQQLIVLIQIVQGLKEQSEALIKGLTELKTQISSGIKIRF